MQFLKTSIKDLPEIFRAMLISSSFNDPNIPDTLILIKRVFEKSDESLT
jgi:hypothetical protein